MFLPVQIPTTIERQGSQGSQGVAGAFTPVHALMLLSSRHNQVIAFFDMCTADVLAMRPTFLIVGDIGLSGLEIMDQFVEFFDVLGLRAIFFQNIQSVLYLAAPEMFEQQAEQLMFGFSPATDQAGQVIAFLVAVIPIQKQGCHGPGGQMFLEKAQDPARPVADQNHFCLEPAAQPQQEQQLAQDHLDFSAQVAIPVGSAYAGGSQFQKAPIFGTPHHDFISTGKDFTRPNFGSQTTQRLRPQSRFFTPHLYHPLPITGAHSFGRRWVGLRQGDFYCLVQVDLNLVGISSLQWVPGAVGLVNFGGEPATIAESILMAIQLRVDKKDIGNSSLYSDLKPGDAISICEGPLAGYRAIFDTQLSGNQRIRVLLEVIKDHQLQVELPAGQIQRIQ